MQLLSQALGGSRCTGLLVVLQVAFWYDITFETSCVGVKIFPAERYEEKLNTDAAFQALNINRLSETQMSSVTANCRCVCVMERRLKVFLRT